jgi:hypothetical protein
MTKKIKVSFNQSSVAFKFAGLVEANSHTNPSNRGELHGKFMAADAGGVKEVLMAPEAVLKRYKDIKDSAQVSEAQKAEFAKAVTALQQRGALPEMKSQQKAKVSMGMS